MATAEGSTNADYSYSSDNYEYDEDEYDNDDDQKPEANHQEDDNMDAHRIEAQRFIDVALREVNAGNYDKAIKLLDKAKSLYPHLQYDELQDLIGKLQSHSQQGKSHRSATPPPATPGLRQRRASNSDCGGAVEYTKDQLDLVKKINRCKNYYQVLSVTHDATDSDVKRAYKKLALQLHPDKNNAPGAAEAFKLVGTAVSILTDAQKRKIYDDAGANTLSPPGSSTNFNTATSNYQRYYGHMHQNTFESTFGQNDISAEELFNMFFGAFPTQRRRRTAFDSANRRAPDHHNFTEPSLAFGLILVIILISMLSSFFTSDPVYNLVQSSKYTVRRETQHLSVPYYVKENFQSDYQGSMGRLENSVEEDFIYTMKQNCYRERSYREAMMARARSFGSRAQFAQAQGLKMPSCDSLSKIEEIDDLIEKLKATQLNSATATNTTNSETTTTLLNEISAIKDPKLFDKHELAENFLIFIKSDDTEVRKEAAKCIAEITKSEVQRKKFTKIEVIETFLNCLRNLQDIPSMELPIQICRALGNICYLNDEARDIILHLKGDEILMGLLDLVEIPDKENALQFIKVRGGLISNYLLGGEGLAKRAMDLQIMQKIQAIIKQCVDNGVKDQDEDLLLNTLPILSILTENVADLNFDSNLNIHLSRILAASTNPDLAEMCLELLHYQAENDEVKLLLAKDGLCETIYNLLEKYKMLASTSEARALMKLACELIVLILTGDESMHYLYATPLLKNMEDWLDSQDIDLLTTGVLALGNFARTDSHCIYMVEHKIMNKLLEVLSKNNGAKDDVRLQHALLSALRNLVIPKPNKSAVIQAGLVETILPMLEIHQPPVVFKLLGTLRMTVDGQEKLALQLLTNKTLLEQLVHWSRSSDYAGVTGESLRLMAWLVKHAYLSKIAYALPRKGDAPAEQLAEKPSLQTYDRGSLKQFIAHDGTIESMVNMLTSQHLVMQNEALIALCIISVMFLTKQCNASANISTDCDAVADDEQAIILQEKFIKHIVGKKLAELIMKSSDSMTKEIVENLENFINLLKTSEKLVAHLEEHNINELVKSIPILTEYCTL